MSSELKYVENVVNKRNFEECIKFINDAIFNKVLFQEHFRNTKNRDSLYDYVSGFLIAYKFKGLINQEEFNFLNKKLGVFLWYAKKQYVCETCGKKLMRPSPKIFIECGGVLIHEGSKEHYFCSKECYYGDMIK